MPGLPHLAATAPDMVAAVDLGSNSFHMIVARIIGTQIQVIDRLREMVRLGAGLDEDKHLTIEAQERALACLERFGQRLRTLPPGSVRAVGTNTLRQVRQSDDFLQAAEAALGHPIEVIAGREEARLIYLGVAYSLAPGDERRLVVDIGGGSTELIVGQGFAPNRRESLHMGCVSMSNNYFADGRIDAQAMEAAELAAALELRPIRKQYRALGWQRAIGSSGTIRAIQGVVQAAGWSQDGITLSSLKKLRKALIEARHVDQLNLEELSTERRPVFPGGVAILLSVFKALHIESMQVSDQALREGLLYDMMGRLRHEDVREDTIRALCKRYDADLAQAKRVKITALSLLDQVADSWEITDIEFRELLGWAARLHELGLAVSHSQFHKHSAYLVEHSDLPGFSLQEQTVLAALVRGHRRRFPLEAFETLAKPIQPLCRRLCVLLRLAVLLHRARSSARLPAISLQIDAERLSIRFPEDWLERHPLSRMELEQEAKRLKSAGFSLEFC